MATTQNYSYPSSSDVVITGIGNPTGQPVPGDAVYIGGENPSGNLMGAQVDANGNLITTPAAGSQTHVIVDSSALPAGASTSALQTSGNTILASILLDQTNGTQLTGLVAGTALVGKVGIDQTTPGTTNGVVVNSSALPTGAATSANQSTANTSLASIVTNQTNGTQITQVSSLPAIPTGTNTIGSINNISGTVSLPTGASTSALQTTGNTSLASIVTNTTGLATSANQTNGTQISVITPTKGTLTDNSGSSSATPSTSTQIMAANSSRKYLLIENLSTTANIYINFTSAASAAAGSFLLTPGGSLVQETGFISTEAVNILSTVASVPYTAKQA